MSNLTLKVCGVCFQKWSEFMIMLWFFSYYYFLRKHVRPSIISNEPCQVASSEWGIVVCLTSKYDRVWNKEEGEIPVNKDYRARLCLRNLHKARISQVTTIKQKQKLVFFLERRFICVLPSSTPQEITVSQLKLMSLQKWQIMLVKGELGHTHHITIKLDVSTLTLM